MLLNGKDHLAKGLLLTWLQICFFLFIEKWNSCVCAWSLVVIYGMQVMHGKEEK